MKTSRATCSQCGTERLAIRSTPSHGLHAALTLLLCGAWAIPWAVLTIAHASGWQCARCGARVSAGVAPLVRQLAILAAVAVAAVVGWVLLLAVAGRLPTRF
jgi:hypothetical protein